MKHKKITVLYGGEYSEREVSLRTGKAMYDVLLAGGYDNVKLLDATSENVKSLLNDRPDICLLALHGKHGEDGVIQGFLEMLKIPYTGSGVEASAVAFNKYTTKLCFESRGVPTAHYWLSSHKNVKPVVPCVVKPAKEGSTVGISIVKSMSEYDAAVKMAEKYDKQVLIEEFIEGKELTIGIMNGETLPPIWIKPNSGFYDYTSKYTKGATQYLFDTGLSKDEDELVRRTALAAYSAVGCEGVARVDIIYNGKTPYVLEVNTIPGMTETSLLPQAAEKAGIPFLTVLENMLKDGFERAQPAG